MENKNKELLDNNVILIDFNKNETEEFLSYLLKFLSEKNISPCSDSIIHIKNSFEKIDYTHDFKDHQCKIFLSFLRLPGGKPLHWEKF